MENTETKNNRAPRKMRKCKDRSVVIYDMEDAPKEYENAFAMREYPVMAMRISEPQAEHCRRIWDNQERILGALHYEAPDAKSSFWYALPSMWVETSKSYKPRPRKKCTVQAPPPQKALDPTPEPAAPIVAGLVDAHDLQCLRRIEEIVLGIQKWVGEGAIVNIKNSGKEETQ